MVVTLYLFAIILILYVGYIFVRHSSAVYLEPEKVAGILEASTGLRRKYLQECRANPRILLQLTVLFKSFLLVLVSLLTVLSVHSFSTPLRSGVAISYLLGLALVWFFYLVAIEYFPRRKVLEVSERGILRHLSLQVAIFIAFKPLMILYDRAFSRMKAAKITEDLKEDIIERAIETLADQAGVGEAIVEEDEKEMIGQIFLLDVTEVREVMVPRINMVGIEKGSDLEDIRQLTKKHGFSRYPVYDENPDKIIGILYIKDIFTELPQERNSFDITQYIRKPHFVPETKKISDLLHDFKSQRVHIAIVVDEYGGTSGLVTLEDILEEIVGEIQDEHDYEKAPILKLSDNSYKVDAGLPLEELIDELNLDYETEEFETIGGLIYDLVGSVPASGTIVRWKDILFEVERVEGQRIISVKAWIKKGAEF
jgi:putative hemolysin